MLLPLQRIVRVSWYYLCSFANKRTGAQEQIVQMYFHIYFLSSLCFVLLLLLQCKLSSGTVSERVSVMLRHFFCFNVCLFVCFLFCFFCCECVGEHFVWCFNFWLCRQLMQCKQHLPPLSILSQIYNYKLIDPYTVDCLCANVCKIASASGVAAYQCRDLSEYESMEVQSEWCLCFISTASGTMFIFCV